jgi:hypothetical protein
MATDLLIKTQILNEIDELYNKNGGISVDKTKIASIMRSGTFIKTQFYGSNKWNVNLVLDNSNDMLKISFVEDDGIPALLPGDNIRCRFTVDTYDLNLLCNIVSMKCNFLSTKSLKILKADIWKNKRGSSRHNAGFLCMGESELNEKFSCYLVNLSESGTGLVCRENLRVGSNVKLSIFINESKKIDFYSLIVRSKRQHNQKFEYGSKFINMSQQFNEIINNFTRDEKIKENKIYNELCNQYGVAPLDFV